MQRSHYLYISTVALATLLALWLALSTPAQGSFHGRLQGLAYDTMLPRGPARPDRRILIVDIDEQSLQAIGRWPWPRETLAALLERIQGSGPAVIGLDILLPEPGDPAGDRALAAQLKHSNVVAATAFALPELSAQPTGSPGLVASDAAGLAPSLAGASVKLGHITPLHDADFVIRRVAPVICHGECYHTLAAAMLAQWGGVPPGIDPADKSRFCVGGFCLRLNSDGTLSVPYHHPSRFEYLPAVDVLRQQPGLASLEGAMVLVGTSAAGLGDRVATPRSASLPGVEIHALILAAMLDGMAWSQFPHDRIGSSVAVALMGLLALCWPWLGPRWRLAAALGWASCLTFSLGIPHLGYWMDPLPLWLILIALAGCVGSWEVGRVLSQRRKIYRAFAAYVPPVVLRSLVRQGLGPDKLDAQRADVTVFFADIQGFTSLSEQLEPEQLVEITNHLFSEITEEIHRHKGTLDKFMGDAVMAFWGAPLAQDDHPELAVKCAMAVVDRVNQLEPWLAARGYPRIRMTMGLESGVVTVGNLGSRQRRAYTVMGKTVNLAAHLQQQCKELGQPLLCGPTLCDRLDNRRITRLPPVAIRGIEGLQSIGYPNT